jgi:hypothetical protein
MGTSCISADCQKKKVFVSAASVAPDRRSQRSLGNCRYRPKRTFSPEVRSRPEPVRSRFPRFCFYGSARTIVAWSKSVDRSINLGRTFWLGSIGGLVSWPPGFSFKQGSASGDRGGLVGCVFGGRSRWAGGEDPMVGWGFGGRSTPGERRKEPATGLLQSGTMVV